ncbi:hypothetical protein N9A94_06405 [Akkermansiaceae bacterium]|nr:hypothetical protein [Akkermansiaceae bacterium]MDB4537618.1 hypothetical protein [Akkermansiaceae bacterium]
MDAELNKLEEELKKLSPLGMPDDMISRLDNAMARWHEQVPVEEKIVPLTQELVAEKSGNWLGWRSVAAVAVMGAGVALLSDGGTPPADSTNALASDQARPGTGISTAAFTPSDARAKFISANDVGVYWTESGQPVRCMEVNTTNTVYFQNEKGEKVIIEKPVKEVLFVPANID